jgi:polyhydroxyalkanoate synthase
MREGIFAALYAIEQATGESKVTAIGYCIGGTLLAMTLAYMAETGDRRIASASFFTTQTDFSQAGDLKIFVDEESLRALEKKNGGDRLSRCIGDGFGLQYAPAGRSDLVLCGQ